nr:unnamed protein product [Callosobruchus chinensis]
MAGTLLVVIVAMVPLLPEATTKPLFFFYGDSYEDLATDYIEYPSEDTDYYGDEKEETPSRPTGNGSIINNGVVVTINGIPFNCTPNACVLSTNNKGEGGNGSPPSKVTPPPQKTTPPSDSDDKETASKDETTKTPSSEGTGKS